MSGMQDRLNSKNITMRQWQQIIGDWAQEKGWWEGQDPGDVKDIATKLCLVHSEVSEALEAIRDGKLTGSGPDGKPEGFDSELADVVIRVLDLAHRCGINLDEEMRRKMKYNFTRPYRHGGKAV
jgi:NTP pyrophosphatase (non-canonical NTP hydrolase)